ncbi:TPA: hypothetical protein ACH3X1_005987 [Trebouxia sp. C0004]
MQTFWQRLHEALGRITVAPPSLFCGLKLTKRAASVFVVILPQQQPAVVRVARYPYQEEVHLECANRHLAPELLGVYPTPGGFNQMDVQLLTHPWHSLEPATPALPS